MAAVGSHFVSHSQASQCACYLKHFIVNLVVFCLMSFIGTVFTKPPLTFHRVCVALSLLCCRLRFHSLIRWTVPAGRNSINSGKFCSSAFSLGIRHFLKAYQSLGDQSNNYCVELMNPRTREYFCLAMQVCLSLWKSFSIASGTSIRCNWHPRKGCSRLTARTNLRLDMNKRSSYATYNIQCWLPYELWS